MESRWLKLKSLHQQILSGSPLSLSTESKKLALELKVLLGLEIGQCEKFPSRCLHCHQLLALTVLKMMFEHPGRCQRSCRTLFTVLELVLIKNLFSKDEFIRYSTPKFLVVLIKSDDITETDKSRILKQLCEKIKISNSSKEMTIILQLFSQVMSRKNGERVNKLAFYILQENFKGIFEAVSGNLKCDSFAHDFYTLLVKVTKYINQQQNCVELLKEIFSQNIYKLVKILLENLLSPEENISNRKLLDFFNTILCYSDKLVLQKKVDEYYVDFAVGFFNDMCNSEASFNLKTYHECFMGDIIEQAITDFPSTRRLDLVVFKAFAVVKKNNDCHEEFESKIKDLLSKITTNLPSSDCLTIENWLSVVFEDQDDAYIECLLCCLDIYTNTPDRDFFFSPYPLFFQFLETFDFDTSVVMDWLVSPETCFLLYLSRLLKVIISEWTLFVKAAHDRYPENCEQDTITDTELLFIDQNISDDKYLEAKDKNVTSIDSNTPMDVSSVEKLQGAKFIESSDLAPVDSALEGKDSLCANVKGYTSAVKLQSEEASFIQSMDHDKSMFSNGQACGTVQESNSDGSFQDKIASLSQGLSAIMAYSDSDSEESENNTSIQSESSISIHSQLDTNNRSCDNSNFASIQSESSMISCDNSKSESIQSKTDVSCDNSKSIKSDKEFASSENSKFESTQSEARNVSCDMKCLDQVMSLLIHVRIQIERLVKQDLFPYNPAHLLSLIMQCEDLYES